MEVAAFKIFFPQESQRSIIHWRIQRLSKWDFALKLHRVAQEKEKKIYRKQWFIGTPDVGGGGEVSEQGVSKCSCLHPSDKSNDKWPLNTAAIQFQNWEKVPEWPNSAFEFPGAETLDLTGRVISLTFHSQWVATCFFTCGTGLSHLSEVTRWAALCVL